MKDQWKLIIVKKKSFNRFRKNITSQKYMKILEAICKPAMFTNKEKTLKQITYYIWSNWKHLLENKNRYSKTTDYNKKGK